MRTFIENQQFYYINDSLNIPDQVNKDELYFQMVTEDIDRLSVTSNQSVDFLLTSIDRMDEDLERWHKAYIEKISLIKSGSDFIQGLNLSMEDAGRYSILEIDTSVNNSLVFSIEENAYTMPPYDERNARWAN